MKLRYQFVKHGLAIITVLSALMLMPTSALAQDIFSDLAGMPNVESTYVSGKISNSRRVWESASGNHRISLGQGHSSLYFYTCRSEESVAKGADILKKYLKKNPDMELMMKTLKGQEEYVVYEKFSPDGVNIEQMIIWNKIASNNCEIVVVNWEKGISKDKLSYYDNPADHDMAFGDSQSICGIDPAEYESFAKEMQDMADELNAAFSSDEWGDFKNKDWKDAFKKKK